MTTLLWFIYGYLLIGILLSGISIIAIIYRDVALDEDVKKQYENMLVEKNATTMQFLIFSTFHLTFSWLYFVIRRCIIILKERHGAS